MTFYQRLQRLSGRLNRAAAQLVATAVLAGWAFFLTLAGGIERVWIFPESTALAIVVMALALAVFLGWRARRYLIARHCDPARLARRIEAVHPEFYDTLNCAVELAGRETGASLHPFAQAVIQQAERQTAGLGLETFFQGHGWRWPVRVGLALAALLMALFALRQPLAEKAAYRTAEAFLGHPGGLDVRPGPAEVIRHSAVTVTARPLRWENTVEIEFQSGPAWQRYPMPEGNEGLPSFTFYDLAEPVRYRVRTASLRSPWYELVPYDPPAVVSAVWTIVPPAYTARPQQTVEGWRPCRVPAGSQISLKLTTQGATRVEMLRGGAPAETLAAAGEAVWQWSAIVAQTVSVRLRLIGGEHRLTTAPLAIETIPDRPPAVEITQPARDVQAAPGETVPLRIYAADDYGLSSLSVQISLSGRSSQTIEAARYAEDRPVSEDTVGLTLDLPALGAVEGDLVAYHAMAVDRAPPDGQQAQSEIYFIEVRTEKEPEKMSGQEGDMKRLDLRPAIEESKRIVRLTHRLPAEAPVDQPAAWRAITNGLDALRGATLKIFEEIEPLLEAAQAEALLESFKAALLLQESAAKLSSAQLLSPSLAAQEQALRELLGIEYALLRKVESAEPSESKDSSESSSETPPKSSISMEDLRQLLEKIRQFSEDQGTLNRAAEEAQRGMASTRPETHRAVQEKLAKAVAEAARALENKLPLDPVRVPMETATEEMRTAAQRAAREDWPASVRRGWRARQELETAAGMLQETIEAAARENLARLSEKTRELASAQQSECQASGRALREGGADGGELAGRQQGLGERYDGLTGELSEAAAQISAQQPESARQLSEALSKARHQDTSGLMRRAAHALNYERYGPAERMQNEAAGQLDELASNVQSAAEQAGKPGAAALQRLIRQLDDASDTLGQMGNEPGAMDREALQRLRQEWSQRMGRLPEDYADGLAGAAAQALGQPFGEAASAARDTAALFRQLRAGLETQLQKTFVEQTLRLRRESAPPPEKYRRPVEDYFRRLGEGPASDGPP